MSFPSADLEFKPFRETYKILTFTMVVGMLYPTPGTEVCRLVGIGVVLVTAIPICTMVFLDMWVSWQEGDVINIMRHITVMAPCMMTVFKMMLFFKNREDAWGIIMKIDEDHSRYNTLPEHQKDIARRHLKDNVYYRLVCDMSEQASYGEKVWCAVVATCVVIFPLTAAILTFYNFVFKAEPVKYMVHDIRKPFAPADDRLTSPYYECMFVYMVYCASLYIVGFIGYDAFFGVSINHARMKMELYCNSMEDAMRQLDGAGRRRRMLEVITEQNDVFRMVELIQRMFNIWLGLIIIATALQLCNLMYQVLEGYGIEHKYLIFILGSVVHIYLPCRYAANLGASALEVGTRLYCCGWERVHDERARRTITFMIARAQVPMNITAFNMIDFNMELFVSIMQSSYSMFTLLRS